MQAALKRYHVIFFSLIWSSSLFAQVENKVKEALASRDFVSFRNFTNTLSATEENTTCYWTILRDITADFREGVFYFTKSIPDKENPAIHSIYPYRVRLIVSDRTILYYELSEKRNKKVKKEWVPYYDSISWYKNDSLFAMFRQSFRNTFDGELNETELFIDDLAYGHACGNIGADPLEKILVDKLVATKNKEELFIWLKSTNLEKQLYAVDGLYQLKESGTTSTNEELRVIKNVLSKKGTFYQCRGCVYSWKDIWMVTYKFKFE